MDTSRFATYIIGTYTVIDLVFENSSFSYAHYRVQVPSAGLTGGRACQSGRITIRTLLTAAAYLGVRTGGRIFILQLRNNPLLYSHVCRRRWGKQGQKRGGKSSRCIRRKEDACYEETGVKVQEG